jgi:dethiobiotin synthetase
VGKTLVTAAMLRVLAIEGVRAVGLKPVATGGLRGGPGAPLRNDDAIELRSASPVARTYDEVNPYCFEPAIAPHLAAAEAGVPISVAALADWYERVTPGVELALVEGAGGWRVPLHPLGFLGDFPEHLGLGVVLVVGLTLGCLNHAVLTREAIERAGRCPWLGWVGVSIDPGFERREQNIATLAALLGSPPLALVPWLGQMGERSAFGSAAVAAFQRAPRLRELLLAQAAHSRRA